MGKIEKEETVGKAHILHNGLWRWRCGIAGEVGRGTAWIKGIKGIKVSSGEGVWYILSLQRKR
jgi:hypothetical protein